MARKGSSSDYYSEEKCLKNISSHHSVVLWREVVDVEQVPPPHLSAGRLLPTVEEVEAKVKVLEQGGAEAHDDGVGSSNPTHAHTREKGLKNLGFFF